MAFSNDKQKQFVNVGHIFHSGILTFRIEMDCVCAIGDQAQVWQPTTL